MSYERAGREIVFRAKLVFGLTVLGGVLGLASGTYMLAREAGFDALGVPFLSLAGWVAEAVRRGFGGELLAYSAAGAVLLTAPVLWLLLKPRSHNF